MNAPPRIDADSARAALLKRMLSGQAGAAQAAPQPIGRRDPARPVPLTLEQSQLWLHAQMAPEMPLYNESITIHRLGSYDHEVMAKSLTEFVRRHPAWRTCFVETEGGVVQHVAPPFAVPLPLIDLSDHPDREGEALRLATEAARTAVPLDAAPLFRAYVARLGPQEHRLYLTLHHIIFDGVSIYRTLVPELAAIFAAFEAGAPSPLPEPALDYADYALWQADQADRPELARQIGHWREALAGLLPRLELAGDRPRPAQPTHAGSMEVFELDEPLVERLKALARAEGATLYMVLLAAYKAMLFRYTGDTDIIVGGVTDTRRRPELQPLVGYFLNTMALRSRPHGAVSFRDYLAQVKASVIGALGASDVPFDRLVRELGIKRGQGTHPLFNTLFSIEPPVDPFPPGWDLTQMDVVVGAAKYDLYLELDERPDGFAGRFLYSTELFDVPTIRRMIGHWQRMLTAIAEDPAQTLAALPMLGADEQAQLSGGWDGPALALPFATVVDGVMAQAAATPDAVAIEQCGARWRYRDLVMAADGIAAALAGRVMPGALIGLALDRTPWMVAAMLGVLKAGAAYLPLDPRQPPARLKALIDRAGAALVIADRASAAGLPDGVPKLLIEELDEAAPFVGTPPAQEALAYCRYTSGSTGEPKGVEISHGALANLLATMQQRPGFASGMRLLAITTLSFDIAELELWLPLVSGGTVLLASRDEAQDMVALAERIARDRPDMMQATPATWRGLIEAGWAGDTQLQALCGGEALTPALADALLPRVGALWNMYGPTETTVWSTVARVQPGAVSIGSPIANTSIRLLDADGALVPLGAVGELCIGGMGLARGYRGRRDLTAERFVDHAGARVYRTGDRARWRPDGTLECLGRRDNEVKVRGFRITLEEVEAALAGLPGVQGAAARTWPDAAGGHMLAAYVVGSGEPADWRAGLAALLPDYMIPSRFVAMPALPLGATGKVDRAALPTPTTDSQGSPPANAMERRLAAIWQDVLGVPQVMRDDDFFDLGGHSLLIARLLRRLKTELDVQLPMGALFRARRLADMAALIASGRTVETPALVPIQPAGTQTPIIWLEAASLFVPLAERLGPDQPFLGLALGQVFEKGCPERFEDAAALVAAAVRDIRPHGPYRLGGLCTAGIMAHAVAVQLRTAGEEVELLVLAHAAHPPKLRRFGRIAKLVSKLRYHVPLVLSAPSGKRWRYFVERIGGLWETAAPYDPEAVLAPRVQQVLEFGAWRYDPPDYDGAMLVIEPKEGPRLYRYADAWAAQAHGPFTAHVAPGDHWGMIAPPHVDAFAAYLNAALETPVPAAARAA